MEQSRYLSNSDTADPHHNAVDRNGKVDTSQHITAEEQESREGMPEYPGLERWMLVETIGVGAYGDVYRAKDSKNEMPEAAIKIIRKCELDEKQVCEETKHPFE
jgi:serine/threonine protein kinase